MPKVNPWGLSRPALHEEARTFTDPAQPDHPLYLHLQQLDGPAQLVLGERARELTEVYVTGKQGQNGAGPGAPAPFNAPGGGYVPMSRLLVNAAVTLEAMQVAEPQDKYTFADIVGIAVMYPTAWPEILAFIGEVEGGGQESPPAVSASPPEPPSMPTSGTLLLSGTYSSTSERSTSAGESSAAPSPE